MTSSPYRHGIPLVAVLGLLLGAGSLASQDASFPIPELGVAPPDRALAAEAPALRHLASALPGAGLSAADLLDPAKLTFTRGPDPSALLEGFRAEQARRAAAPGATPLRVLSYNTGLLSRKKYFGLFGRVEVPEIATRRLAQPARVLLDGWDVLLLQEVWEHEDVQRWRAEGEAQGYVAWEGSAEHHDEHGLLILLKRGLVSSPAALETGEYQYQAQYGLERWPGPGIKRGLLWVAFESETLGKVRLVDTHLTAFPGFWSTRSAQVRELGLLLGGLRAPGEITLLGGDLNAGSYYAEDTWVLPSGEPIPGWWSNTLSYGLVLHYLEGGLDLFAMGTPAADVTAGREVPNTPQTALTAPFGDAAWCQQNPPGAFTASDCNSLYFRSYAGTEYPARMDHLLAHDPQQRISVAAAGLAYTLPEPFEGGVVCEPSDHYGVWVQLDLAPPGSTAVAPPAPPPADPTPAPPQATPAPPQAPTAP